MRGRHLNEAEKSESTKAWVRMFFLQKSGPTAMLGESVRVEEREHWIVYQRSIRYLLT